MATGQRCSQQLVHTRPGSRGNERDIIKEKMDIQPDERASSINVSLCMSSEDHTSATRLLQSILLNMNLKMRIDYM